MSRMANIVVHGNPTLTEKNLVLYRVLCHERMSTLSETIAVVDLEDPSEDKRIDWGKYVDAFAIITMSDGFEDPAHRRSFSGYISEVVQTGDIDDGYRHELTLKPWFWFLSRDLNTRIIQNKTVIEIINQVVAEFGMSSHLNIKTNASYIVRPYTVQYRESSFDFLSRLMEEEGLYYYFDYTDEGHTMVIVDDKGSHPECPNAAEIPFNPKDMGDGKDRKAKMLRWSERLTNAVSRTHMRDYLFYTPTQLNETDRRNNEGRTIYAEAWNQSKEVVAYDIPSGQMIYSMAKKSTPPADPGSGPPHERAQLRLEAARAHTAVYHGFGDAFALTCGKRFTLTGHPRKANQSLIIATTHTLELEGYRSGASSRYELEVDVEAIPMSIQWRAPLHTPKPLAGGPQTATVVGPAGEEIYTDEYGRVKVQFYWDRDGKSDQDSSVWMRVSQGWALAKFGMMTIPRIGEEVVVDFIDGDLDHPIITGRVNNATNMPAYELPDNKTRSWLKSNSSKGGGGYNELRFEDKKGSEEVFIHGQKDLNQKVLNDQTLDVGHDLTQTIGNDQSDTIGRDFTESIGRHVTTTIGANQSDTVGGNKTQSISGNLSWTGGGNRDVSLARNDTSNIGGSQSTMIAQNYSMNVAGNYDLIVGGNMTIMAASLNIMVGGTMVSLKPASAAIITPAMTVTAQGKISMLAGGMTEITSGGMVKIMSGVVMIN